MVFLLPPVLAELLEELDTEDDEEDLDEDTNEEELELVETTVTTGVLGFGLLSDLMMLKRFSRGDISEVTSGLLVVVIDGVGLSSSALSLISFLNKLFLCSIFASFSTVVKGEVSSIL